MAGPILVVDDDASNRALMGEILQSQGFEVITATNGLEGLEKVHEHSPDVVLLDIMMPQMDGLETCRRIKANPETQLTPVVLVTALAATQDRLRGIDAGADDFLNKPYDTSELLARVRSLVKLKARTDELERAEVVLFALARSIEAKDPYTSGHCERLADLSTRLGKRLGLPEEQILALRRGGIVHDIGKVAVPDSILLKRGPLTAEEWRIMREHPAVGERICAPLKSFRLVLPIIRSHHEKFDGSGYPDGLRGEAIPITARVMQLADVYDALTTERPYKPALSNEESFRVMEEEVARGWWDPNLFAEFRDVFTFAKETKLQLETKEVP
ncbi:MAG: response regulator [Acidobacteria bacterium]|nr:response regulator [Acidobacteriota bacterium]